CAGSTPTAKSSGASHRDEHLLRRATVSTVRLARRTAPRSLVPALVESPECLAVTAAGALQQLAVGDRASRAAHIIHNDSAVQFVTNHRSPARCHLAPPTTKRPARGLWRRQEPWKGLFVRDAARDELCLRRQASAQPCFLGLGQLRVVLDGRL